MWLQTGTINMLSNISRNKGDWTIKFSQLIEYNKRNIFLQKSWRVERLTPDLFLLFSKALFEVKAHSVYFVCPQLALQ